MKIREIHSELWLPVPLEDLFPFYSDARNLEKLSPPWVNFKILTPAPIVMRAGALIDYQIKLRGFPLRWRTRINSWEPPNQFSDEQIRGPYRYWLHEHSFKTEARGTRVIDHIRYAVYFDFLVHDWLVRPDIDRIFKYRTDALKARFNATGT